MALEKDRFTTYRSGYYVPHFNLPVAIGGEYVRRGGQKNCRLDRTVVHDGSHVKLAGRAGVQPLKIQPVGSLLS